MKAYTPNPNVIQETVNLDDLKFVPVSNSEFERLRLKDGDLLFVRTNGNADNVGRCAVFDAQAIKAAGHNAEEFIYASYLIRARLQLGRVTPLFVQHFLACPEGCRALRARSKASASQFNINTEGLGTIPIPVPPLPLQKEFLPASPTSARWKPSKPTPAAVSTISSGHSSTAPSKENYDGPSSSPCGGAPLGAGSDRGRDGCDGSGRGVLPG